MVGWLVGWSSLADHLHISLAGHGRSSCQEPVLLALTFSALLSTENHQATKDTVRSFLRSRPCCPPMKVKSLWPAKKNKQRLTDIVDTNTDTYGGSLKWGDCTPRSYVLSSDFPFLTIHKFRYLHNYGSPEKLTDWCQIRIGSTSLAWLLDLAVHIRTVQLNLPMHVKNMKNILKFSVRSGFSRGLKK